MAICSLVEVDVDFLLEGFQWLVSEIVVCWELLRGSSWSTKLRSLVWSGSLELFIVVEHGFGGCPLVLRGSSTVLPVGVVAVVF